MSTDREMNVPRVRARRGGLLVAGIAAVALLLGCTAGASQEQGSTAGPESSAPATSAATDSAEQPGTAAPSEPAEAAEPTSASEPTTVPAPEPTTPVLGQGIEPAHLRVASIDVDEDVIDLGLQADGSMEVPSDWDRVGWFTGGGRPGGRGPTVMAGHVDSPTREAVFYRLTEMEVGDVVEVTDVEGTLHTYEVYRVEDVPKDDYPTHEVFGAVNADELRLITCTGDFDAAEGRHADNRVVFAVAIDA